MTLLLIKYVRYIHAKTMTSTGKFGDRVSVKLPLCSLYLCLSLRSDGATNDAVAQYYSEKDISGFFGQST